VYLVYVAGPRECKVLCLAARGYIATQSTSAGAL